MLEVFDNKLGGCLTLFILSVLSIWYISPNIFFDEKGNSKSLDIGNFNVNRFGVCVVIIAILVYYVYALIRYSIES